MTVTSAEVQTLTAEVRVLMVGNRQVTLSVYRQLDTVNHVDIAPFGRVRDSQDKESGTYVVGCDKSGVLVRSHMPLPGTCSISSTHDPDTAHFLWHYVRALGITRTSTFEKSDIYTKAPFTVYFHRGIAPIARPASCGPEFTEPEPKWKSSPDHSEWYSWKERIEAHRKAALTGQFCDMTRLRQKFDSECASIIDDYRNRCGEYMMWRALPLIVLAGLR